MNDGIAYNGSIDIDTVDVGSGRRSYLIPKYDLKSKNDNIISNEAPKITFVTHGLKGSYNSWQFMSDEDGNNRNFYGSILDQLNQVARCDFYVAKIVDDSIVDVDFYKVNISNIGVNVGENSMNIRKTLNHIVVFFSADSATSALENDLVYSEFNYMASVVVNQVKERLLF